MTVLKNSIAAACIAIFLAGCSVAQKKETAAATPPAPPADIAGAHALESRGQYIEALKLYGNVRNSTRNPLTFHLATLGQSRCLSSIGNQPAALAALTPLPFPPKNAMDAEICAMAGDILIRMERFLQAEELLSVTVASVPIESSTPEQRPWLIIAHTRLASVARRNGCYQRAAQSLNSAALLLELSGDNAGADKCRQLASMIFNHKEK